MPETEYQSFDKNKLLALAERLEAFAKKYRYLAEALGEHSVTLPNQKTLEKGLTFVRTHAGRATIKIENLVDDLKHESLGKSIAAEAKEKFEVSKKPKRKPKP